MPCITAELQEYHYTECGLDNVLITGMPVLIDDDGDEIISIPRINLLHALIVMALAEKQGSWSATELRFVRTEMGLTQSELGELIGKDRQTIARWEKDETDIDSNAEIVIRMAAQDHLVGLDIIKSRQALTERPAVRVMSKLVKPGTANSQIVINSTAEGYERAMAA